MLMGNNSTEQQEALSPEVFYMHLGKIMLSTPSAL